MANIKIRFFVERDSPDGNKRYYWSPSKLVRDRDPRWVLTKLSDDRIIAIGQAEELNKDLDLWRLGRNVTPGVTTPAGKSVKAMMTAYMLHEDYKSLAEKTRREYRKCLRHIEEHFGDIPIVVVTASDVQEYYDEKRKSAPAQAAAIVRVIRLLFAWGNRHKFPNRNPAAKPKLHHRASKQEIWPAEAVAHVVAAADAMGWHSIGTAVTVNEWLGQRQGDVLAMTRDQVKDGWLTIIQSKTGAEVQLPIGDIPRLATRLDEERERQAKRKIRDINVTNLITCETTDQAWRGDHFRKIFRNIRDVATRGSNKHEIEPMEGVDKLVFMALRHTAITRLAELGVDTKDIAAVTGHSVDHCEAIIDRYLTRTRKMAQRAFKVRLDAEGEHPNSGES